MTEPNNSFDGYFNSQLLPLIQKNNKIKEKYRSKFWSWFWTVIFLCCINVLIILFKVIMYKHPFSLEQLLIMAVCAVVIVAYPLYKYKKQPLENVFMKFFDYFPFLKYKDDDTSTIEKNYILPPFQSAERNFSIVGKYNDTKLSISEIKLGKPNKFSRISTVSKGILITFDFSQDFLTQFIVLEKYGFYKKTKIPEFKNINSLIHIPAANYFNVFAKDENKADLLGSSFFENLLDLKGIFKAKKIYLQSEESSIQIYLENAQMYFDNSGIWSSFINTNQYKQLHDKIEKVFHFMYILETIA